ncbi:MAG: FGGY-family carbohydrate kinase [Verrucomicrobiae bacterium]|nr:FGGY-family carbohydrate kinase [Verrucomicrobiae bacterium]
MNPASRDFLLAFDCGSTNFKAAIFDAGGRRLADHTEAVRYSLNDGVRVELDPEETWETALRTLRGVSRAAGLAPEALGTLTFASQAQTFTICDDAGRAFMPLLSWLDQRASAEAEELGRRLARDFHRHCSLGSAVSQLQLAKMLWAKRCWPAAFADGRRMASLPGFLALRLAGLNAMDPNLAAMSGLYSLQTGGWWSEALAAIGLEAVSMPDLAAAGAGVPLRCTHPDFPLPAEARVVFAGNDQTCGAMGNDCVAGEWLATLGTALVVYRCAGENPGPYHPFTLWGPWPHGGFYELATHDKGCAALDWARERLMPGATPDDFAREAAYADPSTSPLFFPSAIRGPNAWSAEAGLSEMARAVYEGILFALRDLIFDDMDAGARLDRVCAIGGGSQPDFRLQLMADILERPVRRGTGDALDGAARLARGRLIPRSESEGRQWIPSPTGVHLSAERHARWKAMNRARFSLRSEGKA